MRKREKLKAEPNLFWLEEMVRLMDTKFKIPGTNFRFGLDPILGLLPVIGDVTSFAISGGLILYMIRFGASRKVIILMLLNIILDASIGSIPVLGTIFDFYYKANDRNINLLRKHYQQGKYKGTGNWIVILVAFFLVLLIFGMLWGLWKLIDWLFAFL